MTDFVLDSSVAFSWFFDDERSPTTDQLLDRLEMETAVVPSLWYFEVANVLAISERRRRTTPARIAEFMAQLEGLTIVMDEESPTRLFRRVFDLARRERLSGYDAAYLELAMRLGIPLATKDAELADASKRLGVVVLGAD
jgi:predicted nucleic acid-binding protein